MYESFTKHFSVSALNEKISCVPKMATTELIRTAITLYVILEEPTVPVLVEASIVGTLGYFICPIDLIPDFLPGGLIDDLAVLAATLSKTAVYKNKSVENRVKELLPKWTKDP